MAQWGNVYLIYVIAMTSYTSAQVSTENYRKKPFGMGKIHSYHEGQKEHSTGV